MCDRGRALLEEEKGPHQNPHTTTQAKRMQAEWQYMLVERMEPPTKTSGGLFLPSNEQVRPVDAPPIRPSTSSLINFPSPHKLNRMIEPTHHHHHDDRDQDPLYVVRVVSFGEGIVGESGVLAPFQGLEVGDVAYTKQPWGIGPRDDTFDGRKFSFVRQNDVLARIET